MRLYDNEDGSTVFALAEKYSGEKFYDEKGRSRYEIKNNGTLEKTKMTEMEVIAKAAKKMAAF